MDLATYCIGDIHGNLPALRDVLNQIEAEVCRRDAVVFLGDYIDRGPSSKECVEAILEFRDGCPATVICLRGNHEDWMLRTRGDFTDHSWLLSMDAFVTVRSYSAEAEQILRRARRDAGLHLYTEKVQLPYDVFFDSIPPSHAAFFSELRTNWTGPDCLCSHGGLNPSVGGLDAQTPQWLIWGKAPFPEKYGGSQPVVYGHHNNPVLNDRGWPTPRIIGNTIGIDTISHGVLTAVRMPDGLVFQSKRYDADYEPLE